MHEYITIGNVVYPSSYYFERGKWDCRLAEAPVGNEIDYSYSGKLLLSTMDLIKDTLTIIFENPEHISEIAADPDSIDKYLRKTHV